MFFLEQSNYAPLRRIIAQENLPTADNLSGQESDLIMMDEDYELLSQNGLQSNEILCKANNDCISTTFCCSSYSCVNPRTCLHGNKTENDFCDYNFECLSRCCVNGRCNHILECYSQCNTNQDCIGKTIEGKRVDGAKPAPTNAGQTAAASPSGGCCSSNLCT